MAGKYPHHYSVYESGTDRPICIHATAVECAAVLGIEVHTFHTYVTKQRKNHPNAPRWIEIFREDVEDAIDLDF